MKAVLMRESSLSAQHHDRFVLSMVCMSFICTKHIMLSLYIRIRMYMDKAHYAVCVHMDQDVIAGHAIDSHA